MVNNEMKFVDVLTYSETIDEYGQYRQDTPEVKQVQMVVKNYSRTNVDDPRYVDVTDIGLTYDKSITTKNQIRINNSLYDILFVIESRRLNQVLMKKHD